MCCGRFSDCTFTSAQGFKNAPVMPFKCKRDLKGNQEVTSTFSTKRCLHRGYERIFKCCSVTQVLYISVMWSVVLYLFVIDTHFVYN